MFRKPIAEGKNKPLFDDQLVEDRPDDGTEDRPDTTINDRPVEAKNPFLKALNKLGLDAKKAIEADKPLEIQLAKVEAYYSLGNTRPDSPRLEVGDAKRPSSPLSTSRTLSRGIFNAPGDVKQEDAETQEKVDSSSSFKR